MPAPRKIEYEQVEPGWRAGIKSPGQLAAEYTDATGVAVTPQAIRKHFVKAGVPRDLAAKIHAKAEAKVLAAMVPLKVLPPALECEVEVASTLEATVRIEHKAAIRKFRERTVALMNELEDASDPNLWAQIRALAASPLIDPSPEQTRAQDARAEALIEALNRAIAFPTRVAGLRALSDSLKTLIGLEREALGLDNKSAGDRTTCRTLSDIERAARIMSILDRARRVRDAACGGDHSLAGSPSEGT